MGLTAAKLLHHRALGGGREDKNIYRGDSDEEWETCITHANLSLVEAVKKGDLQQVIQLVHSGDCNKVCLNICARMASARGLVDIMKFLFQSNRAAVNSKSKRGFTPLKLARLYENAEAVDFLTNTLQVKEDSFFDIEGEDDVSDFLHQSSTPKRSTSSSRSETTPPRGFNFLNQFALQPLSPAEPALPSIPPAQSDAPPVHHRSDTAATASSTPSPSLSPRASPSASPPASPREAKSFSSARKLNPILKPLSAANAKLRHRGGTFQTPKEQRSWRELQTEEEAEDEERDGITIMRKDDAKEMERQRELEKKKKEHSSVQSNSTNHLYTPTVDPSIPIAPSLSSFSTGPSFVSVSSDIPCAPPLFSTASASGVPLAPPLDGIPGAPPLAPLFAGGSANAKSTAKPGVAMKALHWDVLPDIAASGSGQGKTLWSELAQNIEQDGGADDHASQLEALFAKKTAVIGRNSQGTNSSEPSGSKQAKKSQLASTVIDLKRSNNIEIAIKRFRLSWCGIRDAIFDLDWDVLTLDRLETLVQSIPAQEEMKQIQNLVEGLKKQGVQPEPIIQEGKSSASSVQASAATEANFGYPQLNFAENFFHVLSSVPRCSTRLKLMLFARNSSRNPTMLNGVFARFPLQRGPSSSPRS